MRFNGRIVCTEPRGTVETFNAAHMYISDHWHPPAQATVSNMKLEHKTPKLGCTHHTSCNYDPTAAFDDDSCVHLSPGMECGCPAPPPEYYVPPPPPGYPSPPPPPPPPPLDCNPHFTGPAEGPFQFLPRPGLPATMDPIRESAVHAMVNLPLDYTISFSLQPTGEINEAWSNIIHFTATGNNCCEYGDRVPAVWFYPGSLRLHIIDGQPSNGNDECEIPEVLQPERTYHIEIKVTATGVDVSFDGQHKCHEPKAHRQSLSNVRV